MLFLENKYLDLCIFSNEFFLSISYFIFIIYYSNFGLINLFSSFLESYL